MSNITCVGKEKEELERITKAAIQSPSLVPEIELSVLHV